MTESQLRELEAICERRPHRVADLITMQEALPAALAEIRRLKAALREACDIGAFLHAHKCPGYENGQCEFKEPMARIAQLRKEAES